MGGAWGLHPRMGVPDRRAICPGSRTPRWSQNRDAPQSWMGEGRGLRRGSRPRAWGFLAPLPLRCRLPRRSPQTRPGTGAGWCRWRPRPAAPRRSPGPPGAGPARRRLKTMTKTKTRRTTRRLLRRRPLPLEPQPRRFPPPPPPRPPQPGGRGAPRGRRRRPGARGAAAGPGRVAAGRPPGPGAPRRRRPRWSRVGRGSATDSCAPCSPREVKQREGEATTQGGGEAEGGGGGPGTCLARSAPLSGPHPAGRYAERRVAPVRPATCMPGPGLAATPGRGRSTRGPGRRRPPARPPRNLDNCMPRPPGAAGPGKRRRRRPGSPTRSAGSGGRGGGGCRGRLGAEGAGPPAASGAARPLTLVPGKRWDSNRPGEPLPV